MKKRIYLMLVLSFVLAFLMYPSMPEKMASHWNIHGNVDNYINKFWGLFLFPIIIFVMVIMFHILPKIDPSKNIKKFQTYYDSFALVMTGFMFYIYMLTLAWNSGYRFNMTKMMLPVVGLLIIYIGFFLKKAKRNWFVGIRTPWTLSNTNVWNKTHKLASQLFIISGIMMITAGFILPSLWLILAPILISSIVVVIYSYVIWKRI